jgi:putative tricarboxylic transport membrane protein
VILNLPLVGLWTSLLKVPYRILFPAIIVFSCIGIYSLSNNAFDLYLTAFFGILGFLWMKFACPPAPMLLGFVLGPMMEENLRRALLMSRGDPMVFLSEPISLGFIIATVLIVIAMMLPALRKRRGDITD